jgi:hypothetical protein
MKSILEGFWPTLCYTIIVIALYERGNRLRNAYKNYQTTKNNAKLKAEI